LRESIKIEGNITGAVSYATLRAGFAAIDELVISNTGDQAFTGLMLAARAQPGFGGPWSAKIDVLAPGESLYFSPVGFPLLPEFLMTLEENVAGTVEVGVFKGTQELAYVSFPLTLTGYNSWTGRRLYPQTLACHIIPEHPLIHKFLQAAERILAGLPGDLSLTGYKNQDGIRFQLGAIFAAIAKEELKPATKAPSYNLVGQPVCAPEGMLASKRATLLELTLFYASCLEAAGLHPLILFDGDRVLAGCHMTGEIFDETVQNDGYCLTPKLAGSNPEILLLDLNSIADKGHPPFVDASDLTLKPGEVLLLDVHRARLDGVAPLPSRRRLSDGGQGLFPAAVSGGDAEGLTLRDWEHAALPSALERPLLDLDRESSLQLLPGRLSRTVDTLLRGDCLTISPPPKGFDAGDLVDGVYQPAPTDRLEELVASACADGLLHSFLSAGKNSDLLSRLAKSAKSFREDRLRDRLYLAGGVLRWYLPDEDDLPRLAPLLLFPARLLEDERGYSLCLAGRPILNPVLPGYLADSHAVEVKALSPLSMDGAISNFQTVFNAFRQAVVGRVGWSVKEHLFLGLFDPTPWELWEDLLARAPGLETGSLAERLMTGSPTDVWPQDFPTPTALDETYLPSDLCLPYRADASQLRAVCAAGEGHSFVLSGPAGSGKTQTLVNIAANMLCRGKRVLLLSGKEEPITGLHERLDAIGLSPFSLRAQSEADLARDIRAELETLLNLGRIKHPDGYREQAEKLHALRSDLNAHADALHKEQAGGFSLYQAISILEANRNAPAGVGVPPELPGLLSRQTYKNWTGLIGELTAAAGECGGVVDHPLSAFRNAKFSPSLIVNITGVWRDYRSGLLALEQESGHLRWLLSFPHFARKEKYQAAYALCDFLLTCPAIPARLYAYEGLHRLERELEAICALGKERDDLEAKLLEDFHPSIFSYNEEDARAAWEKAEATWVIPRTTTQKKITTALGELYRKPTSLLTKEEIPTVFDRLTLYRARQLAFERKAPLFAELFGIHWKNGKADFAQLRDLYQQAVVLDRLLRAVCGNDQGRKRTDLALAGGFFKNLETFRAKHGHTLRQYKAAWEAIPILETTLSKQMRGAFTHFSGVSDWLGEMREMTDTWLANQTRLRDWCNYLAVREKAAEAGIAAVADALEAGEVPQDQILPAFHKALFTEVCERMIGDDPRLQTFTGRGIEEDIARFAALSEELRRQACQELAAALSSRLADALHKPALAEQVTALREELRAERPIPLDWLTSRAPELLPEFFPCMLLSPPVAARLTPRGLPYPPFDLVMVDDAALLAGWEGISPLSTGRSTVLTGDCRHPLPLPGVYDLPGADLLTAVQSLGLPEIRLDWHYRSDDESLSAFAATRLYGGSPRSCPAPSLYSKVSLIQVSGNYDPATRQNEAEAQAVVDQLAIRLRARGNRGLSLGVVTFSAGQRDLIEEKLSALLQSNLELADEVRRLPAPILVKYAGDWEGHCRDIVLLSLTFGKAGKKPPAFFGPLGNRDSGRLLRLALTRAKTAFVVCTSLRPEQLNSEISGSRGLSLLADFLRYAGGQSPLALPARPAAEDTGALEEAIAAFVRSLGYQTRRKVGSSGFVIEVGVFDPGRPGHFVLAILTDGENYKSAPTAKDRLILTDRLLIQKGWRIHRVWSLDWRVDPEKEMKRIEAAIAAAIENPAAPQDEPVHIVNLTDYPRETDRPPAEPENEIKPETEIAAVSEAKAKAEIKGELEAKLEVESAEAGAPDDPYLSSKAPREEDDLSDSRKFASGQPPLDDEPDKPTFEAEDESDSNLPMVESENNLQIVNSDSEADHVSHEAEPSDAPPEFDAGGVPTEADGEREHPAEPKSAPPLIESSDQSPISDADSPPIIPFESRDVIPVVEFCDNLPLVDRANLSVDTLASNNIIPIVEFVDNLPIVDDEVLPEPEPFPVATFAPEIGPQDDSFLVTEWMPPAKPAPLDGETEFEPFPVTDFDESEQEPKPEEEWSPFPKYLGGGLTPIEDDKPKS